MDLVIREILETDAEAVGELSGQLGYPASAATMRQRIAANLRRTDHAVFVAVVDGVVSGWIDVGIVQHLQGEPYGEIGGLVVSSTCRSLGIGCQLVARAETWVRDQGVPQMLVRSRIKREDSHRFYLREGYARTKTSAVFTKSI